GYEREKAAAFVPPGETLDPGRFRSALIHGEVHDGNAHALGGVAGHAGLFGDASSVARLARRRVGGGGGGAAGRLGGVAAGPPLSGASSPVARLAREFVGAGTGIFGARALARFRENLTPGLQEGRTVGWKRAVQGARGAEGVLSPRAFGHTGFTGTSLWIEPETARILVLLTNRVHPEVRPIDMNALRRGFHAAAKDLSGGRSASSGPGK